MLEPLFLEIEGGEDVGVAGLFAELFGAAGEEDGTVGFGEEEEGWEGNAGEY